MTVPVPAPAPVQGSSRRTTILAIAALAVVVAGAAGLWYLFFRPAGPAPVSLGSAPAASGATTGIAGTWNVDPSIGSFGDFTSSFVGYRVQEELASVGATEAVGRTPDVTGSLTVEGTTITAAEFSADLTTLVSDESRRDGQLRTQALETGKFPEATFTLTQPIELRAVPVEGAAVEVTATGDLTLHGVTRPVQVPMRAKLEKGVVTVVGTVPIAFADYGIQKPTSFVVLSVDDNGVMEFQLHFTNG